MIEKRTVHRLAHGVVAAEGKETLLMPPLTFASGRFSLIHFVARMKSTA